MKIINSTEFLRNMAELYEKAGWDPKEVHFSLRDLMMNIDNEPNIVVEATNVNWIPVEERLPDEDGRYLVCLDTGIVDLLKFALDLERVSNNFGEDFVDDFDDYPEIDIDAAKNRHRPGWYAYNYDSGLYEIGNPYDKLEPHVIAWMPLPKPYRRYDA